MTTEHHHQAPGQGGQDGHQEDVEPQAGPEAQAAPARPSGAEDRDDYRPPSGLPRRGYTWEPFKAGNTVALTHGAYSERLVEPRAREIAQGMADAGELPDYLAQPRYRGAVMDLARSLAQRERLTAWLDAHAAEGTPLELAENGEVRGAAVLLERVERAVERHRDRLGLSPLAAARLGKDVAAQQVGLSQLWAQVAAQEAQDGGA